MTSQSWSEAHEKSLGYKGNTPIALLKTGAWIDDLLLQGTKRGSNTPRRSNETTSTTTPSLPLSKRKSVTNKARSWSRAHESSLGHKGNTPLTILKAGAWIDGFLGQGGDKHWVDSLPPKGMSCIMKEKGAADTVVVSHRQRDEFVEERDDDFSLHTTDTETTNSATIGTLSTNRDDQEDDGEDGHEDEDDEDDEDDSYSEDDEDIDSISDRDSTRCSEPVSTSNPCHPTGTPIPHKPLSTPSPCKSERRFHPFQRIRKWKSLVTKTLAMKKRPPSPQVQAAPEDAPETQDLQPVGDDDTEIFMDVSSSDVEDTDGTLILAEENFIDVMFGFLKDEIQDNGLLPCGVGRLFDNASYDNSSIVTSHFTTASNSSSDFDTLLSLP